MSAAVIGMGKANDGFDEVRVPPGGCIDVADEGGRMGWVAGEARGPRVDQALLVAPMRRGVLVRCLRLQLRRH